MSGLILCILLCILFSSTALEAQGSIPPEAIPTTRQQGLHFTAILGDHGEIGANAQQQVPMMTGVAYPPESMIEHVLSLGLWVGALVDTGNAGNPQWERRVMTTNYRESRTILGYGETYPVSPANPFFRTSLFDPDKPNKRWHDDDGDGVEDEDDLDGFDNDGDGQIDEDYAAISESDILIEYTDTLRSPHVDFFRPLGLKVRQKSYAWVNLMRRPILPFDFEVINISERPLRNVYISLDNNPLVGISRLEVLRGNKGGYWPEMRTAYAYHPNYAGSTPIAFTLLSLPEEVREEDLRYMWDHIVLPQPLQYYCSASDSCMYEFLRGAGYSHLWLNFRPDPPPDDTSHYVMPIYFGPIDTLEPGDTVRFSFALVAGTVLKFGPDNLYDNVRFAHTLYARRYIPPPILAAPKLTITTGDRSARLAWSDLSDAGDPRVYWDGENRLAERYPPDHWRRSDPPPGVNTGGRIFEGFRLYRSDDPTGTANTFTLIRQWDMIDSVGPVYEFDTGLDTVFEDPMLTIGKNYWYSVTSFSIPDVQPITYLDWDGLLKTDSLLSPGAETSLLASRKRVNIPFSPSAGPGEVLVVPNPYRVDDDYTFEAGGWEGRRRSWSEEKRLIKFTHLPPKCTLRVFSLSGDIVTTIEHDDPDRGEASWNLMSASGRVIASGVYIFTVESDYGRQVGKFVVIR